MSGFGRVAVLAARVSQARRGRGKKNQKRKEHAGQGQTELPDWKFGGHVKLTDGNILSSRQRARVSTHRPDTDTSLTLYGEQNWKEGKARRDCP